MAGKARGCSRCDRIVMIHSVYQFAIQLGQPATKWDLKVFASTGDVVADTVALANWDPRYLNLLRKSVNVPSPADINTALAATPPPILLDTMVDSDAAATVYVLPPFVPIQLAGKLSPFKYWHRLHCALVTANLK